MDLLTHALCGVNIGITAYNMGVDDNKLGLIMVSVVASLACDSDGILKFFSNKTYLRFHRRFTHQIQNIFILALIVSLIFFYITKEKFLTYYLLALGCIFIHIFLDSLNPYGTRIIPFYKNIRFNIIATVDIFITIILGFNILFLLKNRYFIYWILLGYILLRIIVYLVILKMLKKNYPNSTNIHLIATYNPFMWHVVIEFPNRYIVGAFYRRLIRIDYIDKKRVNDEYFNLVKQTEEFTIFTNLAYCFQCVEEKYDEHVTIRLYDLKYRKSDYYYFQLCCIIKDNKITNLYMGFVFSDEKFENKMLKKQYNE